MKIWHVTIAARYEKGVLLEHMDHSISSAMHPSMVELADYEQLRGEISLAEEGLADYEEELQARMKLMQLKDAEIERLKAALVEAYGVWSRHQDAGKMADIIHAALEPKHSPQPAEPK